MSERHKVLIAGGGVAALEALLAVHELVGHRVHSELLAPGTQFLNRPASVAGPFGVGGPAPVEFSTVAAYCGAELHSGTLASVDPDACVATTGDGAELDYDTLVVAVGARAAETLRGALPFSGPQDVPAIAAVLDEAERGDVRSIAFALARGAGWTLPLYELALMTAVELRDRGVRDAGLTLVTSERAPLWLFGESASSALTELLRERGIGLVHGAPAAITDGRLLLQDGVVPADRTIVLPPVQGPWIGGLPRDDHGFIPVDAHGRVTRGVFAAGDATSFPVKQGGLASQQADVVAETIAADLGARAPAAPFRPVLRGLLLTGGAPLYLRAELTAEGTVERREQARRALRGELSTRALWWPPGKVAGRYLAPYMATARPPVIGREPLQDRAPGAVQRPEDDSGDALELALLMADEDARTGDLAQALHALDAAAALAGGVLPAEAARKRDAWRAALVPATAK